MGYLDQSIIAQRRTAQRRRGAQETAVRHFLDRVANAQDKRGVHERHDNVRIEFICKYTRERNAFGHNCS